MASGIQKVSGIEDNPSPFVPQALDNDIVLDEIIFHLGDNPHELIKYRLVCQCVIKKVNKSNISFQIPLRYGSEVPKGIWIIQTDAQRWARKVLESVNNSLTGTAARIHFDSVVIDRDFYLTGIQFEWEHFLKIHGESIRHLKFKIRRGESARLMDNYVSDCKTLVSMENLRALFNWTTNLESLDFCIRFSLYGSTTNGSFRQRMFLGTEVPQLQKLANITIQEPHRFPYTHGFLKEILSMAPNLTSLYIKPTTQMSTLCRAIKSLQNQLQRSLTCLGLGGASFLGGIFSSLRLTKLEINNLSGFGKHVLVSKILRFHHSTLVTVILGRRDNYEGNRPYRPLDGVDVVQALLNISLLTFPPVMENLRSLEVNIYQFELPVVNSYKIQFPVLECLTFSFCRREDTLDMSAPIMVALRPRDGPCLTLKEFHVLCPLGVGVKELVCRAAREVFPIAIHHIYENENEIDLE